MTAMKMTGQKRLLILCAVGSFTGVCVGSSAALPPCDKDRVAEIAASLPERPGLRGLRPEDRDLWRDPRFRTTAQKVIADAEKILGEPVPEMTEDVYLKCLRHGDANIQPKAYWNRHRNLETFVFAEAFESKGRFIGKIAEYLEAYCDEKSWLFAVHDKKALVYFGKKAPFIDLCVAHRADLLGFTLALHRSALPKETCARTDAELERWAFGPYRKLAADAMSGEGWWFRSLYNWNPACNSGIVRAALNLLDSREDRAVFVEAAERSSRNYLKGLAPDGYCLEGTGYWSYGFSNYLRLGIAIREATGGLVDLFADPLARKTVVDYAYHAKMTPGTGLPFADGVSAISPAVLAEARLVWPDVASTSVLKADVSRLHIASFPAMAFGKPLPDVKPTMDVLPIRTVFPAAQVFIFRPDPAVKPARREFLFAIKGGHNKEPHNHNDIGSYQLVLDGKAVCGDPMGVTYSRQVWGDLRYKAFPTINSYGHPVPRPARTLQEFGREFHGAVVSTSFTPECDSVTLDLAKAYRLGDKLKSLTRKVEFDRKNARVTVTDRVVFTEPQLFDTPIITYADAIFDYEKQYLTLEVDNDTKADVEVMVKGGDWHWENDVLSNQCRKAPKRLSVALDGPVAEAEISIVYKVKKR